MHRLLLLLALTLPALARADLTGVYQLIDERQQDAGTLTIQVRDEQHIRYDMRGREAGQSGSTLLLGDRLYLITAQGEVMDMDMLGAVAGALMPPQARQVVVQNPKVEATGRSRTVAGLKGEVVRWSDGRHAGEAVLSADARARLLRRAMERLGDRMERTLGDAQVTRTWRQLRDAPQLRERGVLSALTNGGGGMRLLRLDEGAVPAERFALPRKPGATALPGLPNLSDPQLQQMLNRLLK